MLWATLREKEGNNTARGRGRDRDTQAQSNFLEREATPELNFLMGDPESEGRHTQCKGEGMRKGHTDTEQLSRKGSHT